MALRSTPVSEPAASQIEAESRRLRKSITDAFFAVSHEWRFPYVNGNAEPLLARDPGDLLGRSLWEEYPGLEGTEFEHAYRSFWAMRIRAGSYRGVAGLSARTAKLASQCAPM